MRAMIALAALSLAACMTVTPADARRVAYACEDGSELNVVYSPGGGVAQIENPGGPRIELMRFRREGPVLFTSNNRRLRGDGEVVSYEVGRADPVTCRSVAPEA